MNTPNIFTKYLRLIVTCLVVAGVSACSFPAKRKPAHSQANTEQTITQQEFDSPSDYQADDSQPPEKQQEILSAETESSDQKHSTVR